jgi:hypothetical protein
MGKDVKNMSQAWDLWDKIWADQRVAFLPEPDGLEKEFRRHSRLSSRSPKVWADAYLLAFASVAYVRLVALEPGKPLDGFPGFLLGESQIIETLQIEPKLRARAKEMSEAQSGVARDSARPMQDLRDAPLHRRVHVGVPSREPAGPTLPSTCGESVPCAEFPYIRHPSESPAAV